MGNQSSSLTTESNNERTLLNTIDFIATNLILTQNFNDLKNLSDMNYCNNLVILTSNAIENNLNHLDVYFLSQRLKAGKEINEMSRERVSYMKKDNISNIDIKNKTNKRRMCIGIAKFYVKLAHLFAAIVTTINPTYSYKDNTGQVKQVTLLEKSSIPKGVNTKIENINLCGNRINALINNHNYNVNKNTEVSVNPNFCQMNYRSSGDKKLSDEPGIPELQQLYFDKYDYDQGGFGGRANIEDNMTAEMYAKYKKDLLSFYRAYTGNNEIPVIETLDIEGNKVRMPSIKKFSDIPLRSYHKSPGCKQSGFFNLEYKGTLKDKLFYEYAEHIKKMLMKTEKAQADLLKVIDQLFIYVENPETNNKEIVINPVLNENKLDEIVDNTRKIIVDIYLTCEEDFVKGLDIYEAIVETQIKETSISQIAQLEKALNETLASSNATPAVDKNKIIQDAMQSNAPIQIKPIQPNQPIQPTIQPMQSVQSNQPMQPMQPIQQVQPNQPMQAIQANPVIRQY